MMPRKRRRTSSVRQLVFGAVLGDGLALDEFHDEEGPALVGDSAIEQMGDIRVREPGEQLTLGEESRPQFGGVHVAVEELERDLLVEGAVHPLGAVDRPHPALADGGEGAVGPDAESGVGRALELEGRGAGDLAGELVEELGGVVVEGQQFVELATQLLIAGARFVEIGRTLLGSASRGPRRAAPPNGSDRRGPSQTAAVLSAR